MQKRKNQSMPFFGCVCNISLTNKVKLQNLRNWYCFYWELSCLPTDHCCEMCLVCCWYCWHLIQVIWMFAFVFCCWCCCCWCCCCCIPKILHDFFFIFRDYLWLFMILREPINNPPMPPTWTTTSTTSTTSTTTTTTTTTSTSTTTTTTTSTTTTSTTTTTTTTTMSVVSTITTSTTSMAKIKTKKSINPSINTSTTIWPTLRQHQHNSPLSLQVDSPARMIQRPRTPVFSHKREENRN